MQAFKKSDWYLWCTQNSNEDCCAYIQSEIISTDDEASLFDSVSKFSASWGHSILYFIVTPIFYIRQEFPSQKLRRGALDYSLSAHEPRAQSYERLCKSHLRYSELKTSSSISDTDQVDLANLDRYDKSVTGRPSQMQ